MTELSVDGLGKAYGAVPVLEEVSLRIAPGTLVALLGASGSGKTTLLRLICGFERPDRGTVALDGHPVGGPGLHVPPEHRRIGYVAQEGALFPHLDVAGNVAFGLPRGERRAGEAVRRLLAAVGLPASYAGRFPHQLSGGEQQRVALVRALATRPRVVLLDEPFSSLDAALRHDTRTAVADALAETGATALLVTHDQSEALSMGQQVAVLRRGRMVQIAEPDILYRRPVDAELARFLGEAVLLPGRAENDAVDCMLGRLRLAPGMPEGPVEVMIRPEQVRVAEPGAGLATAHVARVAFFGPDAMVTAALGGPDGTPVKARVPGHCRPWPGSVVGLAVDGEVVCFSHAADASAGEDAVAVDRPAPLEETSAAVA